MQRVSEVIEEELGLSAAVLMGANIADEVAREDFCETSIGVPLRTHYEADCALYKALFQTPYFRVRCCPDVVGVELCGALKNAIALAAGVVDGLGLGANTKAAVIRIGLDEMRRFCHAVCPTVQESTFFESCGVADLITTCYGGRNRRIAEQMVLTGKSFEALEVELMNGQKLQGPLASEQMYYFLKNRSLLGEFPLTCAIYRICFERQPPSSLIEHLADEH